MHMSTHMKGGHLHNVHCIGHMFTFRFPFSVKWEWNMHCLSLCIPATALHTRETPAKKKAWRRFHWLHPSHVQSTVSPHSLYSPLTPPLIPHPHPSSLTLSPSLTSSPTPHTHLSHTPHTPSLIPSHLTLTSHTPLTPSRPHTPSLIPPHLTLTCMSTEECVRASFRVNSRLDPFTRVASCPQGVIIK